MRQRQKVLLGLVSELNGRRIRVTKTFLDKLLFLMKKEHGIGEILNFYNFYPYDYGPFSSQFIFDLADLQSRGYLNESFELSKEASETAQCLPEKIRGVIADGANRGFGSTESIRAYVYGKYPEYAARSKLVKQARKVPVPGIFSIGYEKNDIDLFLDRLIQNEIEMLVDVRANPFSMNFAFTKNRLEVSLKKVGIGYLHFPELGIGGKMRKNLDSNEDYEKLFRIYREEMLPKNMETVGRVARLGKEKRIALMCFECSKEKCHRGVLAERLEKDFGEKVAHI